MFKLTAIVGLLFATAIFATIPISPQVTPRGVELSVDQAQAVTYGRARRVTRRVVRRDYRYTRRAVRRGAVYYGAPYRRCRCLMIPAPTHRQEATRGSRGVRGLGARRGLVMDIMRPAKMERA